MSVTALCWCLAWQHLQSSTHESWNQFWCAAAPHLTSPHWSSITTQLIGCSWAKDLCSGQIFFLAQHYNLQYRYIILSYTKYICMFSSIYRYGFIDIKNLTIVLQWKSHSLICFIDQSNYQMRIQEILSSTPPSSSIISFPGPNAPQVNYIKDLVSNQWGPIIECRGDDGGCSEGCGRRRSWHRYIL